MALLDDIAGFLSTQSTAFTLLSGTGGNLVKAKMLDVIASDTVTAIYETQGSANTYVFSSSTGSASVALQSPAFQILCRSTSYATARSNAETAYGILDGLAGRNLPTATGTRYAEITAAQPPFFLQRDDNDRYIVSTNYLVKL